jgi:hypothetical protein
MKCLDILFNEQKPWIEGEHGKGYMGQYAGCGLCQTGVPCESRIPAVSKPSRPGKKRQQAWSEIVFFVFRRGFNRPPGGPDREPIKASILPVASIARIGLIRTSSRRHPLPTGLPRWH